MAIEAAGAAVRDLLARGWRKIEPNECCLCGAKPPKRELTIKNDPRQLTMFEYWAKGERLG